jgi:hypothetical protein
MTSPVRQRIEGAPEALPAGERILWEGKPDRAALARHAFHTRGLTLYFVVVIGLWAINTRSAIDGEAFRTMFLLQVGLAALAVLIAHVLAYASARTTTYAITDRRVVMRIGIVLPMTLNLPYRFVEGASTRVFGDGTGQIALQLSPTERLAWLVLWPHVRPWKIGQPEPVLRGLTDHQKVGEILREAALQVSTTTGQGDGTLTSADGVRGATAASAPSGTISVQGNVQAVLT